MKKNNQIIDFVLPTKTTLTEIIDVILEKNGLKDTIEEYYDESNKDNEPKVAIIRDVALIIFQDKIPENKLVELLEKHLETSKETAEKIIQDIKENLIPYAKIIDLEKEEEQRKKEKEAEYQKEKIQEELLNKIRNNAPIQKNDTEEELPIISVKKIDITDVEKNAEKIEKEKRPIFLTPKENKIPEEMPQESKPDPYKEAIE